QFGDRKKKNSHPVAIYDNNRWWWKDSNKDGTVKYYCSMRRTDKCTAKIKLKDYVVLQFHKTKSLRQCYNEAQAELVDKNIPEDVIAANFRTFKDNTKFLRYDNKSELNRIIIFIDDKLLKILSDSKQWFMDGTFKTAPKPMMQLFTIHAKLKQTTIPCAYILFKKKTALAYREAPERETEAEIFSRQNGITVDEIEAEVYRIWDITGQTNKRKRISDKERFNAEKNLKEKIRKEEMCNKHLRFRERYQHLLPNFTASSTLTNL
ncbi:unnamed protein product, partial [Brachionus calyciflorus]